MAGRSKVPEQPLEFSELFGRPLPSNDGSKKFKNRTYSLNYLHMSRLIVATEVTGTSASAVVNGLIHGYNQNPLRSELDLDIGNGELHNATLRLGEDAVDRFNDLTSQAGLSRSKVVRALVGGLMAHVTAERIAGFDEIISIKNQIDDIYASCVIKPGSTPSVTTIPTIIPVTPNLDSSVWLG